MIIIVQCTLMIWEATMARQTPSFWEHRLVLHDPEVMRNPVTKQESCKETSYVLSKQPNKTLLKEKVLRVFKKP